MPIKTSAFQSFVREHDELPAFKAVYITLVFLIAALLNLGFFLLLILVHIALDVLKYRQKRLPTGKMMRAIVREHMADLLLFSTALLFAVYLHHSAGIIALSGVMQALETVLKGMLLLFARLGILLHIFPSEAAQPSRVRVRHISYSTTPLTFLDYFCLGTLILTLAFIIAAPFLLHLPLSTIRHVLAEQLVPWRI